MAETAQDSDVFWVDPQERGVVPLDGLHVSRSLRKRLLSDNYKFTFDFCFERVLKACADRDETWINDSITKQYVKLHNLGFAHSIEVWLGNTLVGGLYGVAIGGAFFGESMFSNASDGSKLALIALVARLNEGGFTLLDTQFLNDHLATLGGIEISREDFRKKLKAALETKADLTRLSTDATPTQLLQLSTQIS